MPGVVGLGIMVLAGAAGYYAYMAVQRSALQNGFNQRIVETQSRLRLQKEALNWGGTGSMRHDIPANKKYPPSALSPAAANDVERFRSRIVSLPAEELLKEVADGRFTVVQVVQAYKAEAYRVDLRTNCVTEFLEEADEFAKFLDMADTRGPLHGLPISLKETFNLKCYDCTAGLAKYLGKPCQKDAVLVQVLKKLGAVPFVRTNVVQTTCSFGNSNPIYGETLHPQCNDRIPGGSTCGEGSLIALGGSVLGLGTDVGGSLRIPAAMCGIYSLKPTQNRLSGVGVKKTIDGLTGLHDVPGLMGREVQTLIMVFRAVVTSAMFDMDARVVPLPFQKELFNVQRPLKIGYYEEDGLILPTPGCKRAVLLAKIALERMGHEVVPFTVPSVNKAFELTMSLFSADGGKTIEEMMVNEPVSAPMEYIKKNLVERAREIIQQKKFFKPLTSNVSISEKTTYELWKMLAEREEYVDLFTQTWRSSNLDAVLAPGFALPAFHSSFIIPLGETVFVTMLYNMLNFPVGAVPVCRENEADQMALQQYPEEPPLCKTIKRAAAGALGMPLGVQIVGLPWEEEMVLRVMKDLETGLKSTTDEPGTSVVMSVAPMLPQQPAVYRSPSASYSEGRSISPDLLGHHHAQDTQEAAHHHQHMLQWQQQHQHQHLQQQAQAQPQQLQPQAQPQPQPQQLQVQPQPQQPQAQPHQQQQQQQIVSLSGDQDSQSQQSGSSSFSPRIFFTSSS